jgi:hypothetical protein
MSNENGQPENDMFPLDDAAIQLLSDLRSQMRLIEAQFQGALVLFIRQQGLKGSWQVHENGRELVRVQPAPTTEVMR